MSTTAAPAAPAQDDTGKRTLLVGSVMLATLMQALDTTIANVALPDMQGSLSATQDQVSWVLTSYIVAAAILTPVTGWLAGRLGRRRLLIIAVSGFTVASLLCGIATGIGEMVLFRILQGVFGASLVPISQSLLLDAFPKEKHGAAMAMWGMGIMVGPILGPPLGGFLTQNYSWHWVFLINLPIGILALVGIMASVKKDVLQERKLDGIGLGLLALGIGALQLFDLVYTTTRGGPVESTKTIVYYLWEQAFKQLNFGYGSAVAYVLFAATMLITLAMILYSRFAKVQAF